MKYQHLLPILILCLSCESPLEITNCDSSNNKANQDNNNCNPKNEQTSDSVKKGPDTDTFVPPVTPPPVDPPVTDNSRCTHIIENGIHTNNINSNSYPAGSVICAQTDGGVIITGSFTPRGSEYVGFVVKSTKEKNLGAGTYRRMSFVGGPKCGNDVNLSLGSGAVLEDSVVYGKGGRYAILAYEVSNVVLRNVIFRPDGGWGETAKCNEYEPNAALNFYDSSSVLCENCVLLDYLSTAQGNSENLGGLGVNCHGTATDATFSNSISYNSPSYFMEGNGKCNNVTLEQSAFYKGSGNYNTAINRNVKGTTTVTNFFAEGRCSVWDGSIELKMSTVTGTDGCDGKTNLTPALTPVLNTTFLDDPRWKNEMCSQANVIDRGWCSTDLSLSEYLAQ